MKSADIAALFAVPFGDQADSTTINTIPQAKPSTGRASMALGFPSETFIPLSAGGSPPFGGDMNGILNMLSRAARAAELGMLRPFSASYAEAIGGYPAGATVSHPTIAGRFLVCTQDGNTNDPSQNVTGWADPLSGFQPSGNYQPAGNYAKSDDLSKYLQLGGGILTGDLYLSGGVQSDGSLLSKTLYAAISGTKISALFQCGGSSVDTPCGVIRITDKNGNPVPWYFNAASRAITAPSGNTLPEIVGATGRIIIQAYTATADNGWNLTFPQAFSATPLSILVNALESDWDAAAQLGTWSATGFTMTNYSTNTANRPQKISVMAIGPA